MTRQLPDRDRLHPDMNTIKPYPDKKKNIQTVSQDYLGIRQHPDFINRHLSQSMGI
jgi:7-keto-8-aminopelargonate synthetase-like enzyme